MKLTSARASSQHRWHTWRTILLIAIFFLQFEALEIGLRDYYTPDVARSSVWAPLYEFRQYVFSFLVVFPVALLLITWPRLRAHYGQLSRATISHSWGGIFIMQLALYTCFAWTTYHLSMEPDKYAGSTLPLIGWGLLLCATLGASLLMLAPRGYWANLFRTEGKSIILAAAAALLTTALSLLLQKITPALALGTIQGAEFILSLVYHDVAFDLDQRVLGTGDFLVKVSNDCAGYEGIALITVFLTVYLFLFHREFRFPAVLVAYPVGICIIYAFNVLRVAALVSLGSSFSPSIALAGFHSNAGWIAFLAVATGLIAFLHRVRWCRAEEKQAPEPQKSRSAASAEPGLVDALLFPFIALLASMLILGTLTVDFDYLYPVKVILVGAALWYFRAQYRLGLGKISMTALATGVGVFALWIVLVPNAPADSAEYTREFAQWPAWAVVVWVLFRLAGSAITVPLAEELAFRGYLLARFSGQAPSMNGQLPFNWIAVAASSLLFGILHGQWFAGAMAGLAYAWLRIRKNSVYDAVAAHMITNFLLSGYVMLTGNWSLW